MIMFSLRAWRLCESLFFPGHKSKRLGHGLEQLIQIRFDLSKVWFGRIEP
jgi:hypothetical protein